jgi:hypothetical protein
VWVLEVKRGKAGAEMADGYVLFYRKWNENGQLELEYFIWNRTISEFNKGLEFG